jgi:thiosulfate dehydrogenase
MKMLAQSLLLLLLSALLVAACSGERHEQLRADTPRHDSSVTKAATAAPALPLIPATARVDRVADLVKNPLRDSLPDDRHLADQIVLGYHIVRETKKYAGRYVGSGLVCSNCHMNAGQRDHAIPLVGVATAFPQYRLRSARIISLEDRIRDCFQRSLNGTAPPYDSPELMAVAAYITWLSKGMAVSGKVAWRGKNVIAKEKQIPIEKLDVKKGEQLFMANCTTCHGKDGQGVDIAIAKPGPLWGPKSWNDGASLGFIYSLAGFIRYAMPLTNPGTLSDEDAQHISAFINSHARPNFPDKKKDYGTHPTPIDAVYYPIYRKNPLMGR